MSRIAWLLSVHKLLTDILGFLLFGITLGVQEVREEQHLDDDKEDEQFDANDEPQRLAHSHTAETIVIQVEHPPPETVIIVLNVAHHCLKVKQLTKLPKKTKFQKFRLVFCVLFDFSPQSFQIILKTSYICKK